jgi:hypothetical protein
MKKFICFIVSITLALISFSASADTFTFRGSEYRTYYVNDAGLPKSDALTSHIDYKIIINTDNDYVVVKVGDDVYKFNILNKEVNSDPYKGIYIYCDKGITLNLYTDSSDNRHIILKAPKVISVFDI